MTTTETHTASLVCEGPCNPNLHAIDQAVSEEYPAGGVALTTKLALRLLNHTPHRRIAPVIFQCEVCGTERRYGRDW